jgi:phosphatidylinositol glycan class B
VALGAAFVLTSAANTAVDDWLYGTWTCSPYNYLRMNIIEGRAASFGTAPWWFYFREVLMYLVPPYSLLILPILIWGAWRCRRHPLVWAVVPFFIGHTVAAHKETRFLIPVSYALVPLVALSLDNLPSTTSRVLARLYHSVAGRWATRFFVGLNLITVVVMAAKPADERERVFRYLYDEAKKHPITVYTVTTSPYVQITDPLRFYRPETLTVKALGTIDELRAAAAAEPGSVFFFQRSFTPPSWQASSGLRLTPVVRTLPDFVNRVNINDWVSRMNAWTVFEVEAR